MATLVEQDRFDVWANFMRQNRTTVSISKTDLRAALNAVDKWIDDNAASFNSAIPQPARSGLTAAQKAMLLTFVVTRRFEKGA